MSESRKAEHDSTTSARGQQVIAAAPFIHRVHDGEIQVFLARRADTKAFLPGAYEMPGGHIDFGEDIVEGLKREVREELGVEVSVGDSFACFTCQNKIKGSHSIQVGFFARFVGENPVVAMSPEDHLEARWFARHEVIDNSKSIRPQPVASDGLVHHLEGEDRELAMVNKGFDILKGKSLDLG